jgi:hypothetical protein
MLQVTTSISSTLLVVKGGEVLGFVAAGPLPLPLAFVLAGPICAFAGLFFRPPGEVPGLAGPRGRACPAVDEPDGPRPPESMAPLAAADGLLIRFDCLGLVTEEEPVAPGQSG